MEKGKVAAVIVAAGRGERAGQSVEGPKQYRRIGGSPIIRRTLKQFLGHEAVDEVVVVIHEDDTGLFEKAVGSLGKAVLVVHGGPTRQASVLLGLEALAVDPPAKVLIHDAVRPFIDVELIDRTLAAMEGGRSALPALAICDTVKRAGPDRLIVETVPRVGLFGAQTPQGFPFGAILAAHRRAAQATEVAFTDDASVAEWAGLPVALVEGSAANIKLTTAEDIQLSDRSLANRGESVDVRAGNGYDVHRLTKGDHVTLCGVRILHDQALDGHSDADVGLHALTDALLATCGAGDIGDHFPPSDPQWRGAASRIFVEKAIEIVRKHGGRVLNADISLICEAPKIAPHREAMRREIADMTGLSVDRVSVKATTNETIGFVGRREGIAAIATASVSYGG